MSTLKFTGTQSVRRRIDGVDGRSITGTSYLYQSTNSSTAPSSTIPSHDSPWVSLTQAMVNYGEDYPYLWRRQQINYSYGNPDVEVQLLSYFEKGDKGDTGDDGVSIIGTDDLYAVNNSDSTPPTLPTDIEHTGSWDTFDNVKNQLDPSHRILWNIEVIYYSDDTNEFLDAHVVFRLSTDGVSITSLTEWYAYGSASAPISPASKSDPNWSTNWSTTPKVPSATTGQDYVWQCEEVTYSNTTSELLSAHILSMYAEDGTPANVIDLILSSQTYAENLRLTSTYGNYGSEIVLTASLQGIYTSGTILITDGISNLNYIISKNEEPVTPTYTISVANNDEITIRIPYNVSFKVYASLTSADPARTVVKEISPVNETEFDHNFGVMDSIPISYQNESQRTCIPLDGDFFVAGSDFEGDAEAVQVTPQTGDNPKELHWDERTGSGTSLDPYVFTETTDTVAVSGKTYYTVKYKKGIPFIRNMGIWVEMTAIQSNADRMLKSLSSILTRPDVNPYIGALYGWIGNLTVLNAIIDKLTSNEAFITKLNAIDALFTNINVSGTSSFEGRITSSALSTTLEDTSPGNPIVLSLESTPYWNGDSFLSSLSNTFNSAGYYTLSSGSTYPLMRVNGSNMLITSGTAYDYDTFTAPRTQRLTFHCGSNYYSDTCIKVWINVSDIDRTNPTFIVWTQQSYTVSVHAGDVIKIRGWRAYSTPSQSGYPTSMDYSIYDVDSDYGEIVFFNSSGDVISLSGYGYRSDSRVTVVYNGSTYTPSLLYKWGGMSSSSGSKTIGSTTWTDAIVKDTGTYVPLNTSIRMASWSSQNAITLIDTNGTSYSITTSDYFSSMNLSITPILSSDEVVAATTKPKKATDTLGDANTPWKEAWAVKHLGNVNGDPTNGADSRASSYRVFGAVFN